jgi:hypothetical protein
MPLFTADEARNVASGYLRSVTPGAPGYTGLNEDKITTAISGAANKGLYSTIAVGDLSGITVSGIAYKGYGVFRKGGSIPPVYSISWGPPPTISGLLG